MRLRPEKWKYLSTPGKAWRLTWMGAVAFGGFKAYELNATGGYIEYSLTPGSQYVRAVQGPSGSGSQSSSSLSAEQALNAAQKIRETPLYCPTGKYSDFKLGITSRSNDPNAYYCIDSSEAFAATVDGHPAVALQVVLQPDYAKKVPNANLTETFAKLPEQTCSSDTKVLRDMATAIVVDALGGTSVPDNAAALSVENNLYTLCTQLSIQAVGEHASAKQPR